MAAKDYEIVVAGLSGKAYLTKKSVRKKTSGCMSADRREIEDNELFMMIDALMRRKLIENNNNILTITMDGKPIIEIKLLEIDKPAP